MKIISILFLFTFCSLCMQNSAFTCTIFTASNENVVLAGNNEDMCTTHTLIHIIPPSKEKYGCIFWGFIGDENYQGGMNEHGLFFDGAGTPEVNMSKSNLPVFEGRFIMETILEQCKTVEESIEFLKKYSQPSLRYSHNLIADEFGDAAIIEWGNDKLNFIRKDDENFLIATNFNITESEDISKECLRYNIAHKILKREQPSIKTFEKVLSLTHQEGNFGTVYSNLCDLKNKKVYLYNFHNFTIRKEIDLKSAFKKGEVKYRIRDLFPINYAENYFRMRLDCISDFDNAPEKQVQIMVKSKTKIPGLVLSLRGSAVELGRWDKEGIPLKKKSDYVFSKMLNLKEGALIEFELAVANKKFYPVNEKRSRIKEMVLEVNSDTTIVVDVFDWMVSK